MRKVCHSGAAGEADALTFARNGEGRTMPDPARELRSSSQRAVLTEIRRILWVEASIHLPHRRLAPFHDPVTVFLKPMAIGRRLGWRHPSNGKQLPAVLINLAE